MAGIWATTVNTSATVNAASVMVLNVLFDTAIASDMDIADSVIVLKLPISLDTLSDTDMVVSVIVLNEPNNLLTLSDMDTDSDIDLRAL